MNTDPILTNATDELLSAAVFENLYDLFRSMANSLPDGELTEGEKISRHHTFPTNPMFKGVWNTRLSDAEADAAIDETLAWFKERNAVTLKPLIEARDRDGYKYAVLFSAEMGVRVYQRIGLRLTDARINRYLWRNG